VQVNVLDANDNLPKFAQPTYAYSIPENYVPGTSIANLTATDLDSGINGEITYSLQGFGMDKFGSDPEFGGIYLTGSKLHYCMNFNYFNLKKNLVWIVKTNFYNVKKESNNNS